MLIPLRDSVHDLEEEVKSDEYDDSMFEELGSVRGSKRVTSVPLRQPTVGDTIDDVLSAVRRPEPLASGNIPLIFKRY
jgi:hypothetical protein